MEVLNLQYLFLNKKPMKVSVREDEEAFHSI